METELWGTFSVSDHKKEYPFLAEVLLYDRLVIPVPGNQKLESFWKDQNWEPDELLRLIDLMKKQFGEESYRIVEVEWTEKHQEEWKHTYLDTLSSHAEPRTDMSLKAKEDAERISTVLKYVRQQQQKPEGFVDPGFGAITKGSFEEVNFLAHKVTRYLLHKKISDAVSSDDLKFLKNYLNQRPILRGKVEAVSAYTSYSKFSEDFGEIKAGKSEENPLCLLGWELMVPGDSKKTSDDLLKQAIDLALEKKTKQHRKALHEWREELLKTGKTSSETLEKMKDAIEKYRAIIKKSSIITRCERAFFVAGIAANLIAAIASQGIIIPIVLTGAFASAGSYYLPKFKTKKCGESEKTEFAAIFYDAQKRFGLS